MDGRQFVQEHAPPGGYHLVVQDAVNDLSVPYHILTREYNEAVKRLQTAPCVGPRLSEAVVAVLDDPHRFRNARQVGSYAGLTPRRWQTGQSDRQGHVTKAGNPLLRKLLVEIAWLGGQKRTWMLGVYEQVRRGSDKRKKIAIVAVARRLLVRLWAMMRDGSEWAEQKAPAKEAASGDGVGKGGVGFIALPILRL